MRGVYLCTVEDQSKCNEFSDPHDSAHTLFGYQGVSLVVSRDW